MTYWDRLTLYLPGPKGQGRRIGAAFREGSRGFQGVSGCFRRFRDWAYHFGLILTRAEAQIHVQDGPGAIGQGPTWSHGRLPGRPFSLVRKNRWIALVSVGVCAGAIGLSSKRLGLAPPQAYLSWKQTCFDKVS